MEKTCYEKLVDAIIANPNLAPDLADFPEFAERGHSKSEFTQWVDTVKAVLWELEEAGGDVNVAKAACRASYKKLWVAPLYRLNPSEIETIEEAEWFGTGKNNDVLLTYGANDEKNVRSYDYRYIPFREGNRKDVLVVFSGHPRSGIWAAEAVLSYFRSHRKLPYGVMFLGLTDNQEMTRFDRRLTLRKESEARMYLRQMLMQGLPYGWLTKLWMTPKDTSTEDNAELVVETCKRYGLADEDVNLICVSYPVYQLRVATEFSFLLQDKLPRAWVRIAHVTPQMEELDEERVFSYEQPEYQLADLALANCVAHLFRDHGVKRFALRSILDYPEEYKPLAPLFLAYSYPNVVNELCGTNEKTATVLKIIRTLMLDAYDKGADARKWDEDMVKETDAANMARLVNEKISPYLLFCGAKMSEREFVEAFNIFLDSCEAQRG